MRRGFSFPRSDSVTAVPKRCPEPDEIMALRIAAYLHRNRHSTFYFRRAIPPDLAQCFITREIYRSQRTRDHIEPRFRALVFAVRLEAVRPRAR